MRAGELAGRKCNAHRRNTLAGLAGHTADLIEIRTGIRGCAGYFVSKEDTRHAATFLPRFARAGSDIVRAFDDLGGNIVKTDDFRRHFKVHGIAHVVAEQEQNTLAGIGSRCRVHNRVAARGGEHVAHRYAVAEAFSHKSEEGGQMAVTAACNDCNLVLYRNVRAQDGTGCQFRRI